MTNMEWIEVHDREAFERAIWAKADKDPDWFSRILSSDPIESLRYWDAWLKEEHKDDQQEVKAH